MKQRILSARQKLDWPIADTKGQDLEFYRSTRDQIKGYVTALLATL